MHNTLEIGVYVFFYLIEQHSKFLWHTLQVFYMCTLCDSTNINMKTEFGGWPSKGPATQNAVCRSGLRSLSAAECYILSRLF